MAKKLSGDLEWRARAFEEAGLTVRWLDHEHAANAYDYAMKFASSNRYGLEEGSVRDIEELKVQSRQVAEEWLRARVSPKGTLQSVFGPEEVAIIDSEQFLSRWPDFLCPGRDDAIFLHNLDPVVVFYCHDDELEVGQRPNPVPNQPRP